MSFVDYYNSPQQYSKHQSDEDILSVSTDDELNTTGSDPLSFKNQKLLQQQYHQHQHQQQQYFPIQQQFQQNSMPLQPSNNPNQVKYKTQMCENWIKKNACNYGKKCKFAHGVEELKDLVPIGSNILYKTKLCNQFHAKGYCTYGFRCMFQHDRRDHLQIKSSTFYTKYLATHQGVEIQGQKSYKLNEFQDVEKHDDLLNARYQSNENQKALTRRLSVFSEITSQQ